MQSNLLVFLYYSRVYHHMYLQVFISRDFEEHKRHSYLIAFTLSGAVSAVLSFAHYICPSYHPIWLLYIEPLELLR